MQRMGERYSALIIRRTQCPVGGRHVARNGAVCYAREMS